jgi:glycosyltransferase involved in cell wall biosynthesis
VADRNTPRKYVLKARQILKDDGKGVLVGKSLRKISSKLDEKANSLLSSPSRTKKRFISIVYRQDVLKAHLTAKSVHVKKSADAKTRVLNWVISPPRTGGGHQNMFRFIEHLDKNSFQNNIYLYSTTDFMTTQEAAENVAHYADLTNVRFHYYKQDTILKEADAIFATGWETAYPVLNQKTNVTKFYFVQDFEPLFYPVGTEYILAENTYRFGFRGITAGNWLAKKLSSDYGMVCDSYNFGADIDMYKMQNTQKRKEVLFYARPVTERRAFDLGIMVLEIFHQEHPEYIINLAGWDVSDYDIPFPYVNHKTLKLSELSEVYNRCAVGLVLSLTNMSLMPLELLACGVIPVVNDGENNRLVSDNPYIAYSNSMPLSLADEMSKVVEKKDLPKYAEQAAMSIQTLSWDKSKEKFLKIVEKEIYV